MRNPWTFSVPQGYQIGEKVSDASTICYYSHKHKPLYPTGGYKT